MEIRSVALEVDLIFLINKLFSFAMKRNAGLVIPGFKITLNKTRNM